MTTAPSTKQEIFEDVVRVLALQLVEFDGVLLTLIGIVLFAIVMIIILGRRYPLSILILAVLVSGCASPNLNVTGSEHLYPDHTSACFGPCVENPKYDPNDFTSKEALYLLPCLGWSNGTILSGDRAELLKRGTPIYPAILYVNEQGDWDAMRVRRQP